MAFMPLGKNLSCTLLLFTGLTCFALSSISCKSSVDKSRNIEKECSVLTAAFLGDVVLLREKLERGCSPIASSDPELEPIYYVIVQGHKDIVEILLDAGVDPNLDWGFENGNLLTTAIQFGHYDIVELIVNRGANVDREIGHSPLFIALIFARKDIEEFLKSNDAELNSQDKKALDRHPFLIDDK